MLDPEYVWRCRYEDWKKQLANGKRRLLSLSHVDQETSRLSTSLEATTLPSIRIEERISAANAEHLQAIWRSLPWWRRILARPNDYQLRARSSLPVPDEIHRLTEEVHRLRVEALPLRHQLWALEEEKAFILELQDETAQDQARQSEIRERQRLVSERRLRQLQERQQFEAERQRMMAVEQSFDPHIFRIREKDYRRGNPLDNCVRNEMLSIIKAAFGSKCVSCDSQNRLVLDHFAIPKNRGGNFILYDELARRFELNVALLCHACNSAKGERSPFDFLTVEKVEYIRNVHQSLLEECDRNSALRETLANWYAIDLLVEVQLAFWDQERRIKPDE